MAETAINGRIALRAVNNDDIAAYKLPATTQRSGGLSTVGLGQPAYLEAQVNVAIPAEDIVGVTWELTAKPSGSKAALEDSPIGTDVPIYEPGERASLRIAGRSMLRPDVVGQYTVTATIATQNNGNATVKQDITGGTYVGIKACTLCHSAGTRLGKVPTWSKTAHSQIFKDGMNGVASSHYGASCLGCHTVGYDLDAKAVNGGFDDVAAQIKWTFPTVLKAGTYDAVPDALKNVGNIQCENCHGPGSQHVAMGGNRTQISVSMGSGDCGQCHGALTHHFKTGEWVNSVHASATSYPSGAGHEDCVGCHTGAGFVDRIKGNKIANTDYVSINCQTCHEPHGQGSPAGTKHLVRSADSVKLRSGMVVENAGAGALCMNCHQARQNALTYVPTTAGTARFGPHHGPQADMLEGQNAWTYDSYIPSSAHAAVVEDTCVHCHMQPVAEKDTAFTKAGGHTFNMSFKGDDKNPAKDMVEVCQKCHGPAVTSFDFLLFDYDNDGTIDGVQTEVQHLLDKLALMLPPAGKPKTSLSIDATWTKPQLAAAYNYLFVTEDKSLGVHNTAYAVGLLKASIADLEAQK